MLMCPSHVVVMEGAIQGSKCCPRKTATHIVLKYCCGILLVYGESGLD